VHDDEGVGADTGVGADRDGAEQNAVGPDENVVPDRRVTLAYMLAGPAQGDVMEHDAVFPHLRRFPDHDPHAVIDEKTGTDAGAGRARARCPGCHAGAG